MLGAAVETLGRPHAVAVSGQVAHLHAFGKERLKSEQVMRARPPARDPPLDLLLDRIPVEPATEFSHASNVIDDALDVGLGVVHAAHLIHVSRVAQQERVQFSCDDLNPIWCEHPVMNESIGARVLRRAHDLYGWGPQELADAVGVSYETVRKWRSDETAPNRRRMAVLAELLQVSTYWLMTGKSNEEQPSVAPHQGTAVATQSGGYARQPHDSVLAPTLQSRLVRPGVVAIPLLQTASAQAQAPAAVSQMQLSETWLKRNASFSSMRNLALIEGCGDSMRPLFNDGDVLLVDQGVRDIRADGVYALQVGERQLVKRVQVQLDGSLRLLSENASYEAMSLTTSVVVLGRVVLIWTAQRL